MLSGILLVDKPIGPTSHDVVAKTRKALGLKKVGHAGTLDPMASGLLTLGIGSGTKLLTYLVGADKRYLATIRLGVSTDSDDAEGAVVATAPPGAVMALLDGDISNALERFIGTISQVPSTVSAIKVDGKRAYDLARAGEEVVLKAREVTIHELHVGTIRPGEGVIDVDVDVSCSSGTYIRAIARDLGRALGVGGHLIALRRVSVGPFSADSACAVEDIAASRLLDLGSVASLVMPTVTVTKAQEVELGHGKTVFIDPPEGGMPDQPVAAISPEGRLVAIISIHERRSRILVGFPGEQGVESD